MKSLLATVSILLTLAAGALPPPSVSAQTQSKEWQRVHGKVEKVEGSTLTFKADDGRTLTVEMSKVTENVRKALTPGEGVTVIGSADPQPNRFTAQFIQQDSSDPSRGGTITGQPVPKVDEQAWQRIHGKVEKVEGTTLTFKADDGRSLTVDLTQVSENVRKALTPGEGATVIGHYRADQNHVAARFVQQDSPAASPPASK